MRYSVCFLICLAAVGCSAPKLTPEQIAVQDEIFYWAKREDVTFLKWWVVPTAQADLSQLFIEAALGRPESTNPYYERLMVMKEKHEKEPAPTHLVRCRFRQKDKSVDDDKIYHVVDGRVVNEWLPPFEDCDLPWLKDWVARTFPE